MFIVLASGSSVPIDTQVNADSIHATGVISFAIGLKRARYSELQVLASPSYLRFYAHMAILPGLQLRFGEEACHQGNLTT